MGVDVYIVQGGTENVFFACANVDTVEGTKIKLEKKEEEED